MKHTPFLLCLILLCACSSDSDRLSTSDEALGTIHFPVSGNFDAQEHMERGVKLLHHMTYVEADKAFSAAIEADPDCVMAYWGKAMTIVHPLWPDIPNEARLKAGWELVEEGLIRNAKAGTAREGAYLETISAYFENGWEREEKDRLIDVDRAWNELRAAFPEDLEAATFFALFHLAPARFLPLDKSYRIQTTSGLIVEDVLRQVPDHPGALHYRIHAYDFPALAGRALDMCGLYGEVAPDNAHALHMPTHIYTRAGLWERSIDLNIRSAEAAQKQDIEAGGIGNDYLHALDYTVYAYLQRGQYEEARSIRDQILSHPGPYAAKNMKAGAYAFSAIPVRCALESQRWEEAALIEPGQPKWFAWDERYVSDQSLVYFARAIGSVRSGNLNAGKKAIELHKELADQISVKAPATYWDSRARAHQLASRAWLAFAEGRTDEALTLMRNSAEVEAATEKEGITPGDVLPTGELLGDMLMEMGRYEEALAAYQAVLESSPNRFYSLYGTGRAAEQKGDAKQAERYYRLLLNLAKDADAREIRLEHARAFILGRES